MSTVLVICIVAITIYIAWKTSKKAPKQEQPPVEQPIEIVVSAPAPPVVEKKKAKKVETMKAEAKKPAAKRGPKKKVNAKK